MRDRNTTIISPSVSLSAYLRIVPHTDHEIGNRQIALHQELPLDVQKAWRSSKLDDLQTLKAVPGKGPRGPDCDPAVVVHVDVVDVGLPVSEGGVTIDDQLESWQE